MGDVGRRPFLAGSRDLAGRVQFGWETRSTLPTWLAHCLARLQSCSRLGLALPIPSAKVTRPRWHRHQHSQLGAQSLLALERPRVVNLAELFGWLPGWLGCLTETRPKKRRATLSFWPHSQADAGIHALSLTAWLTH